MLQAASYKLQAAFDKLRDWLLGLIRSVVTCGPPAGRQARSLQRFCDQLQSSRGLFAA